MARASGYHYVVGKDGKRHRVYNNSSTTTTRPKNYLRGKGGYYNSKFVKRMNKYVPKGTFSAMGQAGFGPAGGQIGKLLSKITGFGDYKVHQNSMIDEGNSPAAMHSNRNSCIIRHREYITDILAPQNSANFTNKVYPINPGLSESFPWLAPIASQYEQYMIKGMVFEFKSMTADGVLNGTSSLMLGGIIMATDYNPLNGGFENKQEMENTQYTTSCKISESTYHAIECAPQLMPTKQLYVRSAEVPQNADRRLYDLGTFNIATYGLPAGLAVGSGLGELWCTYEIELIKPVSLHHGGKLIKSDKWYIPSVTNSDPLNSGSGAVLAPNSSLGTTINSLDQLIFPVGTKGSYIVTVCWQGTSAAITFPTVGANNCTIVNSYFGPQNGGTATSMVATYIVKMTDQSLLAPYLNFAAGVLPGTAACDIYITQYDKDLTP